ncbi:UNKNOWN [Stylonychia lemnae]|uniref:C2H2-type domain-containing protein n=1 Tax=Stylonychia lemnae TaxID=5949 RepID=A0A078AX85_STYLE|nr:UNKNOWN [Stylonychia lemnae]|eukprot:CDW87070.1 UNKNOWN [Stylonychia lemnae]
MINFQESIDDQNIQENTLQPVIKGNSISSEKSSSKSTVISHNYFCQDCQVSFQKPSKLRRHIQNVHEEIRPFKCDDCGQTYKRKEHLTRHQSSVHASERLLDCPYRDTEGCLLRFPNRDQQRKHIQRKHEKKLYCEICYQEELRDKINPEVEDLAENEEAKDKFEENEEVKSLINDSEYEEYISIKEEKSEQKLVAGPIFFTKKSQLKKHMSEYHDEGYECVGHCGKKFAKKKLLQAHLARIKKNLKKKNAKIYNYAEDEISYDARLMKLNSSSIHEQDEESKSEFSQMTMRQDPYKRTKIDYSGLAGDESIDQSMIHQLCSAGKDGKKIEEDQQSIYSIDRFLNLNGQRKESFHSRFELLSPRNKQLMICNACGKIQGLSQKSFHFKQHIRRCTGIKCKKQISKTSLYIQDHRDLKIEQTVQNTKDEGMISSNMIL